MAMPARSVAADGRRFYAPGTSHKLAKNRRKKNGTLRKVPFFDLVGGYTQPRSFMASTTRPMATMYAALRM